MIAQPFRDAPTVTVGGWLDTSLDAEVLAVSIAAAQPTLQANEVRTNEVRTNEVRTNEVRTNEVRTNEARTSESLADELATVAPGPVVDRAGREVAARYGVDLARVLAQEKATGRAGEVLRVPVLAPDGLPGRLLLIGIGAGSAADLRRAGAATGRACRGKALLAVSLGVEPDAEGLRAYVEGLVLGGYAPPATGLKSRTDGQPVRGVRFLGEPVAGAVPGGSTEDGSRFENGRRLENGSGFENGRRLENAVRLGLLHAGAGVRSRDLAATPSSVKNPGWMVEQARQAAARSGLAIDVWDERRLADEGFGGLLAVGSGSATPPRFVRLDHLPDDDRAGRTGRTDRTGRTGGTTRAARTGRTDRPVVLVGKGITYDSGGLSIKPRDAMVAMKTDMSGAGAVLSVLACCRALGVRRHVVGLLPLAENAVGAASYRPGDVVRHYGGQLVEVANTDAEGRLVLADALGYADAVLAPSQLIDVATLTGAASLGLGRRHAALYATDETLAAALLAASAASGEPLWRMPLVEDYLPALDSDVADLRQVAKDPTIGGGSITAALFLRTFAGGRAWAHLDVAGPARADKDEHEVVKGATGFGARLLLRYLEAL